MKLSDKLFSMYKAVQSSVRPINAARAYAQRDVREQEASEIVGKVGGALLGGHDADAAAVPREPRGATGPDFECVGLLAGRGAPSPVSCRRARRRTRGRRGSRRRRPAEPKLADNSLAATVLMFFAFVRPCPAPANSDNIGTTGDCPSRRQRLVKSAWRLCYALACLLVVSVALATRMTILNSNLTIVASGNACSPYMRGALCERRPLAHWRLQRSQRT